MQMPGGSLLEWQKRSGTERACARVLVKVRWANGFQCPVCGGTKAYPIASRHLYQCAQCRHQVSITADTLFHATKISLVKWFWAIYLMASDKGGLSVLRASKHLGDPSAKLRGVDT
ncbi:transposase [Desulfobulbus sp.]|uniref:transposase n=1 Tax=Desulfobulbus sp. TaxID=895 RepID=UPI0038F746A5